MQKEAKCSDLDSELPSHLIQLHFYLQMHMLTSGQRVQTSPKLGTIFVLNQVLWGQTNRDRAEEKVGFFLSCNLRNCWLHFGNGIQKESQLPPLLFTKAISPQDTIFHIIRC